MWFSPPPHAGRSLLSTSTERTAIAVKNRTAGRACASVVLPVAADVAARHAVPVQVRREDGRLAGVLPADGRYHEVPAGHLTFLAALPDGPIVQASAEVAPSTSVRVKLQGELARPEKVPTVTPLERQRVTLRFLLQSSIDSYEQSREPSLKSTVVAAADEVRLRLTSPAVGVQFLQLLTPKHFPVNVAYAGDAQVKLVNVAERLTADVSVVDPVLALSLEYAQSGRTWEALMTLDLQSLTANDALGMRGVTDAVVLLEILQAAGRSAGVEDAAVALAAAHPHFADFHVLAAECAADRGDHETAMSRLANLKTAGLPLLNRSFVRATTRLSAYAAAAFSSGDSEQTPDAPALEAVLGRLRELAPHIDPASTLLVVRERGPNLLSSKLGPRARAALAAARRLSRTSFEFNPALLHKEAKMSGTDVTAPSAVVEKPRDPAQPRPSTLALTIAVLALLAWIAFAVYLLTKAGATEVRWARYAWVFGSVEAVAFAAAGLLFGTTVNRQRAERAEADADAKSKEAENGRALAAALKAEEPPVVQEAAAGAKGGPQALGGRDDRTSEIAARHARLARELFP